MDSTLYLRIVRVVIPGFLVLYAILALLPVETRIGRGEDPRFFFSWFVFIQTPQPVTANFEIRISRANGETFPEPRFVTETDAWLESRNAQAPEFNRRAGILGEAIARNDPREVERARSDIEELLPLGTVYEIDFVTFNPIERFRTGKVISIKKLIELEKS